MLRRLFLLWAAAIGFAAAPAAAAAPDWTKTVAATSAGGLRMGNPAARVKLIEYGSLACPTCARFAADSAVPLMAQVRSGAVSFEFRNFVLNAPDIAATMLTRCTAPAQYFRANEQFFDAQPAWLGRIGASPASEMERIAQLQPLQQVAALAAAGGLDTLALKVGLTPARAKSCLADQAGLDRILAVRRTASETHGVRGTPTFFVNGVKAEGVHSWAALAPLLRSAGG